MGGVLATMTGGAVKTSLIIGKGQWNFKSIIQTGYKYTLVPLGVVSPVDSTSLAVVKTEKFSSIAWYSITNVVEVDIMGYVSTGLISTVTINGTDYAVGTGTQNSITTATVTLSIATPCVVTWANHGQVTGEPVMFTTTGALPTGLSVNTVYFVRTITTNTFQLGLAPNSSSSIATSGTQSGTHTILQRPLTVFSFVTTGDFIGSTNPGAAGPYTATMTIASPCVVTWTGHGQSNGQRVMFRTTGALPTGLAINTVYYIINAATNTFQLSLTSGGSAIATSGSQSGTHSIYQALNIDLR